MRWVIVAALLAAAGVTLALAADDDGRATIFAASSLRAALPALDPEARYSFGASGTLQLQIERGAPADVFASASREEARALHLAGRCSYPQAFATNRLVLLVPAGNPAGIRSVGDLRAGGRRLAVGGEGVPVGRYTRRLLANLRMKGVLSSNRVSSEPSAAGITAKVAARSADAGFAYVTDARAAGGRVKAIELPPHARPAVHYYACAVRRGDARHDHGRRWLAGLRAPRARRILALHGFGAP